MFTERQDHELLEEAVSEHKLLSGTRDVTVVVQDAHARETRDLNLQRDVSAEIDVDLSLLCGVSTSVVSSSLPDGREALVSNLINHCSQFNNYKYQTINYQVMDNLISKWK